VADNASHRLARVRRVEVLVQVVEQQHFSHPQHRRRRAQFRFADFRQRQRAGMLRIAGTMAAVTAGVAACGGQQKDVHAFGRVFRQRASRAQRLVVRVREHGHQPSSLHEILILSRRVRVCGSS